MNQTNKIQMNNRNIIICQWNLCSFKAQVEHLKLIISSHSPSILALQETRFKQNQHINLKGYKIFFKNRNDAAGGVALYIKSNIHSEELQIQTRLEVIAAKLSLDKPITICNIYLPPHSQYDIEKRDIENILSQLQSPFILVGDFNAKNYMWGVDNDSVDH